MAEPAPLKVWYPADRLHGSELTVRGLACREEMGAGIVDRPRGTGDWLFMVFHGEVEMRAAGAVRQLPGPVLMAWAPEQGHWYGWRGSRWLHSWVHARGAGLDALAGAVGLPRGVPIAGFDPRLLETCVAGLHRELARPDPDPRLALLHLEVLAREAVRAAACAPASAPAPWPEIRRFIDEHHAQRLTLTGLSRRFGLSAQHLCEGFHRWFGVPPIEYLIRLRLDRARVLLSDRNRTVAQVAAEVGWHDAPHFTRLFRRRCGVPPGSLRRPAR